jgi:Transposase IS116/IS110/IS902 family
MHQFCRRHYRGGKPPAELLKRLRAEPAAANPIDAETLAAIVAGFVAQIRVLNTEIAHLEDAIAEALDEHPKAALLENLPRAGTVSLAQLIAEVGPLLDRCHDPEQVAAICGAAPITRASGKTRTVGFRYAANKPARVAITGFADNSRHSSVWAARRYNQARARGARHPTRRADRRPRMAPHHLGVLAHQHRLRPLLAPRRTTRHPPDLTKRTQALPRPRALQRHPSHRDHDPVHQKRCLTPRGASDLGRCFAPVMEPVPVSCVVTNGDPE